MTCTKVKFSSEKDALFYIDKLHKTSTKQYKPVRAYLCEQCLCWHLTSIYEKSPAYEAKIKKLEKRIVDLTAQVYRLSQK